MILTLFFATSFLYSCGDDEVMEDLEVDIPTCGHGNEVC